MNFLGTFRAVNELASLLMLFASPAYCREEMEWWKSGASRLAAEAPPALVHEPSAHLLIQNTSGHG